MIEGVVADHAFCARAYRDEVCAIRGHTHLPQLRDARHEHHLA
jgi:hypothetical protein